MAARAGPTSRATSRAFRRTPGCRRSKRDTSAPARRSRRSLRIPPAMSARTHTRRPTTASTGHRPWPQARRHAAPPPAYAQHWTPLVAADSPVRGYAHVLKQDLVNQNLLFLGTEFGLWISI